MNANARVRMLVGCSILVAVCQPAAYAGGFGGMGASHLSSSPGGFGGMSAAHVGTGVSHVNVPSGAFKTQSGIQTGGTNFNNKITAQPGQLLSATSTGSKIQSGGITLKDKLSLPANINQKLPSSPTGPKFPGRPTLNDKLKLPPGLKIGNLPSTGGSTPPGSGSTPPGSGSTPPGGGSTSPMKDHDHNHFPYWLWFAPAFYGSGYGNWGYPAAPVYSDVSVSSPVVVEQTPVTPAPADATSTDKLTMKLGESYTIDNLNFGERAGELSLSIGGLTLPVRADNWTAQEISFTLPGIGLAKAADGVFQIANADHQLVKAVAVTVVPSR